MPTEMKHSILYCIAVLALLLGACSKTEVDGIAAGEGTLRLSVRTDTRTASAYDPLDYCTIRIYGSEGLIRKYESLAEMPETLQLLAGTYTIRVDAGDGSAASFTNATYRGEEQFVITPGSNTEVNVRCKLLNARVAVTFDPSLLNKYFAYAAGVGIGEKYSSKNDLGLSYSENATGYFLMPEGENRLAWSFAAFTMTGETAEREGIIENVKAGAKYNLTFRYSKDKGGIIDFTLAVDETTDDYDDTIIFTPDADITLAGDGFDVGTPQPYLSGELSYLLSSGGDIASLTLTAGERTVELLSATTTLAQSTSPAAGVSVTLQDDGSYRIALGAEFFAALSGGDHTLVFTATNAAGKSGTAEATVITQGVLPVAEADLDLWHNTATLRARVLDPNVASVKIGIRTEGGQWQEYDATAGADGIWSAEVAPAWNESKNEAGLTVYTVADGTGIFPERNYTLRTSFDGVQTGAEATFAPTVSQPVPYGDMEDGTVSAYSTSNTAAPFWGSGNNTFTKSLCTWSAFAGMGGEHCTKLAAAKAPIVGILAAGNFFSGTFTRDGMGGYVEFGQDYDWKARPTGLKLKYHAKVGIVDKTKHAGAGVNAGDQDISVIFVSVVDWSARHKVVSSTSSCSGMWSPDASTSLDEGAIIGYGILYLKESTAGEQMVETTIPMYYYDKETKPAGDYKLVISCSTSLYGDYMAGCSSNVLYLDDFEWVY